MPHRRKNLMSRFKMAQKNEEGYKIAKRSQEPIKSFSTTKANGRCRYTEDTTMVDDDGTERVLKVPSALIPIVMEKRPKTSTIRRLLEDLNMSDTKRRRSHKKSRRHDTKPTLSQLPPDYDAHDGNWMYHATAFSREKPSTAFHNNTRVKLRGRADFSKGMIIALPHHEPNLNPHIDPSRDVALSMTAEGPVYTKRRCTIVMWLHSTDMFVLPFYTHNGAGLQRVPQERLEEFVPLISKGAVIMQERAVHAPVEAVCEFPIAPECVVHLAGGRRVSFREDIEFMGRLTFDSFVELTRLWNEMVMKAQNEDWPLQQPWEDRVHDEPWPSRELR